MNYLRILGSRLFIRYALLIVMAVCGLLIAMSAIEIATTWRDNTSRASLLLAERSLGAAARIEEHLAGIENQVRSVASMPWAAAQLTDAEREFEYRRLQRVIPSLMELRFMDLERRERVRASQLGPNAIGSGSLPEAEIPLTGEVGIAYGNATFRGGIDPYAWLVLREAAGETAALVNMKFMSDFVGQLQFGKTGRAFVVDGAGYMIAHPDIRLVLRHPNLAQFPDLAEVIAKPLKSGEGRSFDGREARFAATPIGKTGWWAFVEQSSDEVLEPVRDAGLRATFIALAGLACALGLALLLARHLASPIVQLRNAARRISAGDLEARAQATTTDEIGGLADEFNRMAETLQRSYAGLEAKVDERTRELALKRDEADRANAAKSRFLAVASHDLRQPLYAISILGEAVAGEVLPATARAAIDKQIRAIGILGVLFDNLLDISRLEAREVHPVLRVVDLRQVFSPIESEYHALCHAKALGWTCDIADARVRTDPELLCRIVGNLLSNAVRYTPAGSVSLVAAVTADSVRIEVADTGIGIAQEDQARVFEEFVQLANPARDRDKGVGLGLSIVKRLADLLDLHLELASEPGRGTRFSFTLPLAAEASVEPVRSPPAITAPGDIAGMRLWVVEDDRLVREALALQLDAWSVDHDFASSRAGIAALREADGAWPDAVMLDDMLGEGERGRELATWLRKHLQAAQIALVTGNAAPEGMSSLEQEGIRVFRKPVSSADLAQWLRDAMAAGRGAG